MKRCPDCREAIQERPHPAGNPLIAYYECENKSCNTGPIYTINVGDAYKGNAVPPLDAMLNLGRVLTTESEELRLIALPLIEAMRKYR